MSAATSIAVLGQYNSGSTALAGSLHRLGVQMGSPFWYTSDDHATDNYYEPWDLGCQLRYWWNEPDIRESTPRDIRIAYLTNWLRMHQGIHSGAVGAKHPLLCLCDDDLLTAWGTDTLFLRAWRPLEESIARLRARNWFPNYEDRLQRMLWQALEHFCARQSHLTVEYHRLKTEPEAVLREIAASAHLTPTATQFAAAAAYIDRNSRRSAVPAEGELSMTHEAPDRRPAIYHDLHHRHMQPREETIRRSAEVILAELFRRFSPRSALDVGCGLGIWLQVAQSLGVADIRGIEGAWLDKNLLHVPQEHIVRLDLEQPFDLGRRFDLAICLEVAEHLQASAAAALVESLVRNADVVLFSAAIPFQGGHHHVNERFPHYWDQLFRRFGYEVLDFLRPLIWNNAEVLWWLRQNVLVFARRELTRADGPFAGLAQSGGPLPLVHPELYLMKVHNVRAVKEEYDKLLTILKTGGTFTVVPHADGRLSIKRTS